MAFRRNLVDAERASWEALRDSLPLSLAQAPNSLTWRLAPSGTFSVGSAYRALFSGPVLRWASPLWKAPLPLKIKIFVWLLLRDRLPSGVEVAKRFGPGDGQCLLCVVAGLHIFFSCPAARFLWNFLREALGPDWQASDLGEFLEAAANHTGRRKCLFWMVFAAMTCSLWNIRNKMVIERVFLRHASDSIFKFMAFLQLWYPLCRQRDRARLDEMLDHLIVASRRLATPSAR